MNRISLTDTLYEMIERINDDDLSAEETESIIKKAKAINEIGKTIIEERKSQLDVIKFLDDRGYAVDKGLKQLGYEEKP